ncbi:MAG: alpha/beta hydrolase family protein [Microthrixaceae bacterium]
MVATGSSDPSGDHREPAPADGGRREQAGVPKAKVTPAFRAHVAADRLALAAFGRLRRTPDSEQLRRIASETQRAAAVFQSKGWIDDPGSYHPQPPPLFDPKIRPSRAAGMRVERLKFPSGWKPPAGVPGRQRWMHYTENAFGRATVLRHQTGNRPWVICIHGTGQGADTDLRSFRVRHLYAELGCNLVLPVLPLHGPRQAPKSTEARFPTLDVLDNVNGIAQAVWDVRRLLTWIRQQEPSGIGLMGVSLGGYVAALLAGLEDEPLQCVLPIIPATDFPRLFMKQSPLALSEQLQPFLRESQQLHSVVSPLSFTPSTPVHARAIVGGLADKLIDPVEQVAPLWEHWDRPEILWFPGGHIGHLIRSDMYSFIDRRLKLAGLCSV